MADIIASSAASGMQAAMQAITNNTNNITNINSLGYKRMETVTSDNFYNHIQKAGVAEAQDVGEKPVGIQLGTGVRVTGTFRNLSQGTMKATSRPLDIAIVGSGLLAVQMPNGQRGYTRVGALQLNNARQIVTMDGYVLDGDITIPQGVQEGDIAISAGGTIVRSDTGEALGQITLYSFANENGLEPVGNGYFVETPASGGETANIPGENRMGEISQFNLEMSNVDVASEFASFISAQQAYDMSARMLRAVDEMFKELNK
jgi:flagellar basal-body rod protein FlgG